MASESGKSQGWITKNSLLTGGVVAALVTSLATLFSTWGTADYIYGLESEDNFKIVNAQLQHSFDLQVFNMLMLAYAEDESSRKYERFVCDIVWHPNLPKLSKDREGGLISAYLYQRFTSLFDSSSVANESDETATVNGIVQEGMEVDLVQVATRETQVQNLVQRNINLAQSLGEVRNFCGLSEKVLVTAPNGQSRENSIDPNLIDQAIDPNPADGQISECTLIATRQLATATARDRASGVYSRPGARTILQITADDGHFLDQINLIEESYRNRPTDIPPVSERISAWSNDNGGDKSQFSAMVACTNSRGAGRTCLSEVTVEYVMLPNHCRETTDDSTD
jgi:hypothetical protein